VAEPHAEIGRKQQLVRRENGLELAALVLVVGGK
jgi:hypothetical protein